MKITHDVTEQWRLRRDDLSPWSCLRFTSYFEAVNYLEALEPGASGPMIAAIKCEVCGSSRGVEPEACGATFLFCCVKCRAVPATAVGGGDHAAKKAKKAHVVHELTRPEWLASTRKEVRKFGLKGTGVESLDRALRLPHAPRTPRDQGPAVPPEDAPECQVCGDPLADGFVDGVVRSAGWANLCLKCHKTDGIGLGPGRGTLYVKGTDGLFHRAEEPDGTTAELAG